MSPEGILTRFSSIIVRALLGRHIFLSVLFIFGIVCHLYIYIYTYIYIQHTVDFTSLVSFKRYISLIDFSQYLVGL